MEEFKEYREQTKRMVEEGNLWEKVRPMLFVMCGLQCSGKSTQAKEYVKYQDATIVSSDGIREELAKEQNKENIFDVDNNLVFRELYKRVNDLLKENKNVVLDATNTTIKSRRQIFENIKVDCYKECHIMNTPYEECLERLRERNKKGPYIPEDVLERYYKSFEVPFKEEGWDNIVIDREISYEDSQKWLKEIEDKARDFDQHNKWHNEKLLQHMVTTHSKMIDMQFEMRETGRYDKDEQEMILIATRLHDLGKLYTQVFDKEGQAHYYNHENVGAYEMICNAAIYKYKFYNYYGYIYSITDTLRVAFYINYHMKLHQVKTEKAIKKWKGIFGEKSYNNLKLFEEADKYRIEKGE